MPVQTGVTFCRPRGGCRHLPVASHRTYCTQERGRKEERLAGSSTRGPMPPTDFLPPAQPPVLHMLESPPIADDRLEPASPKRPPPALCPPRKRPCPAWAAPAAKMLGRPVEVGPALCDARRPPPALGLLDPKRLPARLCRASSDGALCMKIP